MKRILRILVILILILINTNLYNSYSSADILTSLKKGISNSINSKETNLISLNYDNLTSKLIFNFSQGFPKTNVVSMGNKKFYVDMNSCVNILKNKNIVNVQTALLRTVRTSQFKNNPKIVRAVFELGDGVQYKILYSANSIIFNFTKKVSQAINTVQSKNNKIITLKNINIDNKFNKIEFEYLNGIPNIKQSNASQNRLILDMYGCINGLVNKNIKANGVIVDSIRTSQYKVTPDKVTRVVLDLSDDHKKCKLIYQDNKAILTFENNVYKQENQDGILTYLKDTDSIINISNISALKYNIDKKIITFQLPINYNVDNIRGINDEYISNVQIINGKTFNTIKINLTKELSCYVNKSLTGVSIIISSNKSIKNILPQSNTNLSSKVVLIDPGHGGNEPGASGNGIIEKKLNLEISLMVKKFLEENKIKVYMTRSDDSYYNKNTSSVSEELISRAQYANSLKADFLVSIHTNSASSAAYGIETLYYPDDGEIKKTLQKGNINSKALSNCIQGEIIKTTGAYNRGIISRPKLVILKYSNVVPALVEIGFLSNTKEATLLKTDSYKQKIARGIANGIIKALNQEQNK